MEKDLKELREYLLLTPDYPESNDFQVNLSTEDVTNEEIGTSGNCSRLDGCYRY